MAYWQQTLGVALAVSLLGCGMDSDSADGSFGGDGPMNETLPPWSMCDTDTEGCDTDATGAATTGAADNSCSATADCADAICAASYDMANEEVGAFECQFTCVADLDDSQWCSDDSSCCVPGAVCTQRGYCVSDGSSTGSTTDESTGSTGDGSTGDGSSTGTDSAGTGSTTGA